MHRRSPAGGRLGDHHAPRQICGCAKGFSIDKIAPPADDLANEQPQGPHIQKGQDIEPVTILPAKEQHHQNSHDDAAIDGEAPVPNGQQFIQMILIIIPAVENIIGSGSQHAAGQSNDQQIDNSIRIGFKRRRPLHQVQSPQQKSHRQDDPIPTNGPAPYMEGHLIEFEYLIKKSWEGYIMDHISSSLCFSRKGPAATRFLQDSTPSATIQPAAFFHYFS